MAAMMKCRSCGSERLEVVLSLGNMPLANGLLTEAQCDEPEPRYPLDLAFCPDCALVQITETVPPEAIFCDYPYQSSFSDTNVECARQCVEGVLAERDMGPDSLALEVGSNDGYLLQFYAQRGIPVLGVDPAANIAKVAEERGVPTVCDFFGIRLAEVLVKAGKRADVIHLNNTFAHIVDLNGMVAGLKLVLKDDGVIVIQVPYVKHLIERCEFDTIYHEHLCYFSVTALCGLFQRQGLELADVQTIPDHGGTLRVFARKTGQDSHGEHADSVLAMLREEARLGMGAVEFYLDFARRVRGLRHRLSVLLADIKSAGKSIVGYAASAKGATLLNSCGIGSETLDCVVDRSTVKQGLYTPGSHLPIRAPELLLDTQPDYALLLAWNYADEILGREAEYMRRGGRFICPVPEPKVLPTCSTESA